MAKRNPVATKFQKAKAKPKPKVDRPAYKHPMFSTRQMPELIVFLGAAENKGRPTVELLEEFRETCGHSLKEIAHLVKDNRRHSYQVCSLCGGFVKSDKAC